MIKEVIACDRCDTILGPPVKYGIPNINPADVYAADEDDEEVEREFADGWRIIAFPALDEPTGVTIWHECPECSS